MTDIVSDIAELSDIEYGMTTGHEDEPRLLGASSLASAISERLPVFLAATEMDHTALAALGVPASTPTVGLDGWRPETAQSFAGADVVVVAGAYPKRAASACKALKGIAARVRLLDFASHGHPEKTSFVEWAGPLDSPVDALYELIQRAPDWKPVDEARSSRLKPVTWDRLDERGEAHEWLVKGLLTRGELSMLAGPSQSGKSFLAIDLALAIARGVAWFGRKTRKGGVLYQAGESAKGVRRKRLPAYRIRHACSQEGVPFVLLQSPVNLHASDDDTQAMIEEALYWKERFGEAGLELVVIDTFSAATPGANENASEDMSRVLMRCARISEATGAAVLLVHHMNALGEKPRGHTSIFANLDSVLLCRLDQERRDADNRKIREVKIAKAKDGEADLSWRFVLPAVEIGRDEDGDPVTSCIVAEPNMGLLNEPPEQQNTKGPRLSDKPYNYLLAIKAALDEQGVYASEAGVPLPTGMRVIHKKHVAKAYADRWQGEEEDPAKRDQNMRAARMRLGEKLLAGGYIGSASPWLWLTNKGERVVTPRAQSVTEDAEHVTNGSTNVTHSGDPVTDEGDWLSQIDDAGALG